MHPTWGSALPWGSFMESWARPHRARMSPKPGRMAPSATAPRVCEETPVLSEQPFPAVTAPVLIVHQEQAAGRQAAGCREAASASAPGYPHGVFRNLLPASLPGWPAFPCGASPRGRADSAPLTRTATGRRDPSKHFLLRAGPRRVEPKDPMHFLSHGQMTLLTLTEPLKPPSAVTFARQNETRPLRTRGVVTCPPPLPLGRPGHSRQTSRRFAPKMSPGQQCSSRGRAVELHLSAGF